MPPDVDCHVTLARVASVHRRMVVRFSEGQTMLCTAKVLSPPSRGAREKNLTSQAKRSGAAMYPASAMARGGTYRVLALAAA
jgi:hypothetical protein